MDLFDQASNGAQMPLAARMRPQSLEQMVGQQHLLGPSSLLRRAIEADQLPSVILQGPAGSGKTTLARIIAGHTQRHFVALSGVSATVSEFRDAAEAAHQRRKLHDQKTIVFLDEIHRLSRTQQDALLPFVEEGVFTLIGSTTENPYYTLTTPLLSRCQIFVLKPLLPEDIEVLLRRALSDEQRGLGKLAIELPEEALRHLAANAGGDARVALNALEMAVLITKPDDTGTRRVSLAAVEDALQQPVLKYDRAGDEHYDTISAFIKSIRGSDPDAAIYWLAKMLEAGEDPRFIARRLIIAAAEDIGLADPTAVAPKSNSAYTAISAARQDAREEGGATVPRHLAGGVRPGEEEPGREYLYPHNYAHHWVQQSYLPSNLADRRYYQPQDNPREQRIKKFLQILRSSKTADQTNAKDDKDGDA